MIKEKGKRAVIELIKVWSLQAGQRIFLRGNYWGNIVLQNRRMPVIMRYLAWYSVAAAEPRARVVKGARNFSPGG